MLPLELTNDLQRGYRMYITRYFDVAVCGDADRGEIQRERREQTDSTKSRGSFSWPVSVWNRAWVTVTPRSTPAKASA